MRQKHSLTEGSIWKSMLFFALPILLGNVFQQLYNTADAFIVGKFLDKNAYAAVSSSGSLIFLLVGFFNGIAIGAGVVIARYFGAKDQEKLQTAVHTTLAFGLAAGLLLTGSGHHPDAPDSPDHEDGPGGIAQFHQLFPHVFCRGSGHCDV